MARSFAQGLVTADREARAACLSKVSLRAKHAKGGWRELTRCLRPNQLGLPVYVRGPDGLLITPKEQSAWHWHVHRAQIGVSPLVKGKFCTASLKATLAQERHWARSRPSPRRDPLLTAINQEPISSDEVALALESCPYGSAPGLDHIPYEALKCGGDPALECLTGLYNICWSSGTHPKQWDDALIAPLFKGGPDPHDVSKYRAITLLCTTCKIYEGILANRITRILDAKASLSSSQSGF